MSFDLRHGDCLEVMRTLPDASVDCVLTDPPYGTTACKWDSVIPFEPMWKELKRIAKPKAAICLFGSQPFTSALVMSNPKMFRYDWTWEKGKATQHANCHIRPLKAHEDIAIFGHSMPSYYPQMASGKPYKARLNIVRTQDWATLGTTRGSDNDGTRFPRSVVKAKSGDRDGREHPTQKPVELLRYLIRTYTQEGETVLDFTMGSGSTGVACELENRKFIGIEKDENYFNIATERIEGVKKREPLFMEQAA